MRPKPNIMTNMVEPKNAEDIVTAVTAAFGGGEHRPEPEEVERVMRPLFPISYDTERQVDHLLRERGQSSIGYGINSWMEANDVVSGTGPEVERRIQFLLGDTCTCVLDHLPAAIAHATKDVDPRIAALMSHEYVRELLKKK